MPTFAIGDTVRIARRRCCAEPGAVWEVVGHDRERVVVRSPGGFVVDVPADQLAPFGGDMGIPISLPATDSMQINIEFPLERIEERTAPALPLYDPEPGLEEAANPLSMSGLW